MQQQHYVRPRVTPRLLVLVTIAGSILIALSVGYRAAIASNNPAMPPGLTWLSLPLTSAAYGYAYALVWMCTAFGTSVKRRTAQLITVAGSLLLLAAIGFSPPLHYVATFGGTLIFQLIWFWYFAIPSWRGFSDFGEAEPSKRQFGIGAIILLTLLAASLFAVVRIFSPNAPRLPYWLINVAVWTMTPLVLSRIAAAVLLPAGGVSRAIAMLFPIALAIGLAFLLATAETFLIYQIQMSKSITPVAMELFMIGLNAFVLYGIILSIKASAFAVFAAAGRNEGMILDRRLARAAKRS